MTTGEPRPSTFLSLVAAGACLLGLPLGGVVFAVLSRDVAQAWAEGGWAMYAVLFCAGLAAVSNAVGAFFLPRGRVAFVGVGLVLIAACAGLGVAGLQSALRNTFDAMLAANPADRGVILHAMMGEGLMSVVLAFALGGGLLVMLGSSSLVGALAGKEQRAALGIFGAGAMALGIWLSLLAYATAHESDAYRAISFASPADRATVLFASLAVAHQAQQLSLFMLGAALVCAVAALVVLRGKASMGAVVAGLLLPMAAVASVRPFTRPPREHLEFMKDPAVAKPMRELKGTPLERTDRLVFLDGTGLHTPDGVALSAEAPVSAWADKGTVSVALGPEVKLEQVLAALRQIQLEQVRSVRLVGMHVKELPPGMSIPPPFDEQLKRIGGVRVLLADDYLCEKLKCEFGEVKGDKLTVGDGAFPLVDESFAIDDGEVNFQRAIHLKVDGLTLEQLINAAHAGATESRLLALHLGGIPDGEQ